MADPGGKKVLPVVPNTMHPRMRMRLCAAAAPWWRSFPFHPIIQPTKVQDYILLLL